MIACTRSGSVPKVGGISADSSTPSRPLVPAPTKMIRPPLRSACAMMSTPTAMRSFSRCTAASILRSSFSMPSTMSAAESLSMASVAGLMASVGSDCHFERTGMRSDDLSATSRGYYHSVASVTAIASTRTSTTCASSGGWPTTRSRATRRDLRSAGGVRRRRRARRLERARSRRRSKRSSAQLMTRGPVAALGRAHGRRGPRLLPVPRARPAARPQARPTICSRRARGRRCRSSCRSRRSTR